MYALKSATAADEGSDDAAREDGASVRVARTGAFAKLQTVIYLDPRAFTRDCVGRWMQSSLSGFNVCLLPHPDQIETVSIANDQIRAVIINAGPERMSSVAMARCVSRAHELLPDVPVAVLCDHEDPHDIREAFDLGVQGYIPTSLASPVAALAVHLVCVGGAFAPAGALLAEAGAPRHAESDLPIENFTHRQTQILDCLRRGLANKLIAFELSMCESTVKVHIRNIMKKLNATNRTQVAYLTRGLFEGAAPCRDMTL